MKFKNPLKLIEKKSVMLIIRITSIVSILSVIAIVLTISLRNRRFIAEEREHLENNRIQFSDENTPKMEDFYRNTGDIKMGITYPAHRRKSRWTKDEVEFYWINPRDAGLETLTEENNAKIYDYLEMPLP